MSDNVYSIETCGPLSFRVIHNGKVIMTGPEKPETYHLDLDSAARLCAYANCSIALSDAVNRVQTIDNATHALPLVR